MRWLLVLALLTGCTMQRPTGPIDAGPAPAACRATPEGGPPAAAQADRGIGGTGGPVQAVDRGIGGTGIVGVITGFGSVCLAGEEVAIPSGLMPQIDGQSASVADLRAGQFAAVATCSARQALSIAVSHLVIGPVQPQPTPVPSTLLVAGQIVHTEQSTGSAIHGRPGEWVAVSGLPMPDGTIAATRIDPAPAGRVLLHGQWPSVYGPARIGGLEVRLPEGAVAPSAGFPVIVTGELLGGALLADRITVDPAADNPALYFPPEIDRFVVESYVAVVSGGLLMDHAFITGRDFGRLGEMSRGIARFQRDPGGRLIGTGLRGVGDGGFDRAPIPGGSFGSGFNGERGGFGGFRAGPPGGAGRR